MPLKLFRQLSHGFACLIIRSGLCEVFGRYAQYCSALASVNGVISGS